MVYCPGGLCLMLYNFLYLQLTKDVKKLNLLSSLPYGILRRHLINKMFGFVALQTNGC